MDDNLIFTPDNTVFKAEAKDWRQAVQVAGDILVKQGCATKDYVTNIIKSVEELGPYIVISDGIAIPHARPEDGAISMGYGLLTLKEPVYFDEDNTPVEVLISFSAVDSTSHIEFLQKVVSFIDEGLIDKIAKADNYEQFLIITNE